MMKCCGERKYVGYIDCQTEFWLIRVREGEEEEIRLVLCQWEMKILL
jgi:hypothetical protein